MPRAFSLKWDKSKYNYYDLSRMKDKKSLQREYVRMQKEATRRLGALSRSKNETAQKMYREYQDILTAKPKTKKAKVKAIIAMEQFLSRKQSKVTEIYKSERKMLETLEEHGYNFITKRNLKDFGRFMDAMRAAGYARKGSSSSVMEFLSERGKVGHNTDALKKEFEKWAKII